MRTRAPARPSPRLSEPSTGTPDTSATSRTTSTAISASAASAAVQLASAALGPGTRVADFVHTQLFAIATGEGRRLLALTSAGASYSANSVRLREADFAAVRRAELLQVTGPRELVLGGRTITIARTWRTAVPSLVGTRTGESVAILRGALRDTAAPTDIAQLIGWGGGLTPAGDDIVCGMLAAAHAFADPRREPWCAQTRRRLAATTELSAQFLRLAAAGHVTAELRELLLALGTPHLPAAVRRLLGVGHTSGADLATGVLRYLELRHLEAREGEPR